MSNEHKIRIECDEFNCEGYVSSSVVDKIKKNEFVEFNLRLEEYINETTNFYRYYYSPVKNMKVTYLE